VGKSTMLGMIARHAQADVNVIALLGERGREVREFLEHALGAEGLARSVVIVATGDQAALVRARGALVATAIAEYFRDQGKQVLLMVDSVTRVAMAWREIGLATGEPPTTKGYPPSVFANLPRLLERAGNGERGGITGIYTVLVDGDDFNEPVADATRSHITSEVQQRAGGAMLRLEAAYREKEDLIMVGAYQKGSDPYVDAAIAYRHKVLEFLQQRPDEITHYGDTYAQLTQIADAIDASVRRR